MSWKDQQKKQQWGTPGEAPAYAPSPTPALTAGECPKCKRNATVLHNGLRICNACGNQWSAA